MRLNKLRRNTWAARLGVVALVLNALVPVHLAFDLADALAPAAYRGAGLESRLLAKLTGHAAPAHQHDHDGDQHRPPDCPVCSSLAALGGFTPAAPPLLSQPAALAADPVALPPEERRAGTAVAAYRSRAPPVA